ncbi:MAG TPA: dTDP-4-dehydrorhamnose reductase [Terriglobia bacterium]|nr:dTDP-4-dehydrorhamnose reductase [Terriglobia bacterium]
MRVLLFGANGQLGSDILRAREAHFGSLEIIPLYRKDVDVTEPAGIKKVLAAHAFDALINCTSYHKTDEVEKHASEAVAVNAHAPQHMAVACKAQGALFLHISTDYVFNGGSSTPYAESDSPAPVNVYGASKFLGENLVQREWAQKSLIARVASLFGVAGASGKGGNFVETMLRIAKEKGEVRVVNDIRMSPTSTADAARVILTLLEKHAAPGVYHVVNSGEATWFEFAREIIRRAGLAAQVVPITSNEFQTAAIRPSYSVLNNRKAASLAGPIPDWQDALDRYLKQKGHLRQ